MSGCRSEAGRLSQILIIIEPFTVIPFSLYFNLQLIDLTGDRNPVKVNCWLYANWHWCNAIFTNCRLKADITEGYI